MPLVRPPTVQPVPLPPAVQVAPPGLAVAVYPVIALPPLDDGADHPRATWPLPAVAPVRIGAPGAAVAGVADSALEAAPVPTALAAVTVNE